jgi:putative SOS response-associated peptidase YedK
MCGRYSVTLSPEQMKKRFKANVPDTGLPLHYNAAPGMMLPVIANDDLKHVELFRWGLIPFWAKDKSIGNKMINARLESLEEKTVFKTLLAKKRCIIPADGFYEWKKVKDGKHPYRFILKGEKPFAFAGLWDEWKDEKGVLTRSFTIITGKANAAVKKVHSRMPVILLEENEQHWLDDSLNISEAAKLLRTFPARRMDFYEVSELVNNPQHDVAEVIQPV